MTMETTPQEEAAQKSTAPDVLMSWVSHPLKHSNSKSAIGIGAVVISIVVGGWYMESVIFGALAGVVMFASLAKFFLPTTYTFDTEGVTVKTITQTLTRPWSMFRSFYTDKNGALLSPFVGPSRLENFRGLYLTFSGNREKVLSVLSDRIITPTGLGAEDDPSDSADSPADSPDSPDSAVSSDGKTSDNK